MNFAEFKKRIEFFKNITYRFNLVNPADYLFIGPEKKYNLFMVLSYWKKFLKNSKSPFVSLYFHLPFCQTQRCSYCRYESSVLRVKEDLEKYLNYLYRMMGIYSKFFFPIKFKTLYIGGGTPSILEDNQLARLLQQINKDFSFDRSGIKTFECSSATITPSKIDICKKNGINRISMGVQTLNCHNLNKLNRLSNATMPKMTDLINYILKKNFDDYNIDLIIGLPDEGQKIFLQNIFELFKLQIPSITIYKYYHNPEKEKSFNHDKFYKYQLNKKTPQIYKEILKFSRKYGYRDLVKNPTEGSNFRFVNKNFRKENQYVAKYSARLDNSCLGIGRGAQSFMKGNNFLIEKFDLEGSTLNPRNTSFIAYLFTLDDQIRNHIISCFYYNKNINIKEINERYHINFLEYFNQELDFLRFFNKVKVDNLYVNNLTKNPVENGIFTKIFFNQEYLKQRYLNRI